MVYGYVSTGVLRRIKEPSIASQIDTIERQFGSFRLVKDEFFDRSFSDSNIVKLVENLEHGDILVVSSIERLCFSVYFVPMLKRILDSRSAKLLVLDSITELINEKVNAVLTVEGLCSAASNIDTELQLIWEAPIHVIRHNLVYTDIGAEEV